MKKTTFLLLFLSLISCSTSTESKIRKSIYEFEKKSLLDEDHKIEQLTIDSLDYSLLSIKDFYLFRENLYMQANASIEKNQLSLFKLYQDPQDSVKLKKLTETTRAHYIQFNRVISSLDSLYRYADTSIKVYQVKYVFLAKTNKNSYNRYETKFLYANGLSAVSMDLSYLK